MASVSQENQNSASDWGGAGLTVWALSAATYLILVPFAGVYWAMYSLARANTGLSVADAHMAATGVILCALLVILAAGMRKLRRRRQLDDQKGLS